MQSSPERVLIESYAAGHIARDDMIARLAVVGTPSMTCTNRAFIVSPSLDPCLNRGKVSNIRRIRCDLGP